MAINNVKDFAEACRELGIVYEEFQLSKANNIHETFEQYVASKARQILRRYHPDRNKSAEAHNKFKEIGNYKDDLSALSASEVEMYFRQLTKNEFAKDPKFYKPSQEFKRDFEGVKVQKKKVIEKVINIKEIHTRTKQTIRIYNVINTPNANIYQFSNGRGNIISFIKIFGMQELNEVYYQNERNKNVDPNELGILSSILIKHRVGVGNSQAHKTVGWCVSIYMDGDIKDEQRLRNMRKHNDGFVSQFVNNKNFPQFDHYATSEGTFCMGKTYSPGSSVISIDFVKQKHPQRDQISVGTVDAFLNFMHILVKSYGFDNTVIEMMNQYIMQQTPDMLTHYVNSFQNKSQKASVTKEQIAESLADYIIYPENEYANNNNDSKVKNYFTTQRRNEIYVKLCQIVELTKGQNIFKAADSFVPNFLKNYTNVPDTQSLEDLIQKYDNLTDVELITNLHEINNSATAYPGGLVPKINELFVKVIKLENYRRNDSEKVLLNKISEMDKKAEDAIVLVTDLTK